MEVSSFINGPSMLQELTEEFTREEKSFMVIVHYFYLIF